MDESGFPPSNQGVERVIGRAGNKLQHKQGGASRENVTAEYLLAKWTLNNVANASFLQSPNGWTDCDIALDWLRKEFEPLTREKAAGQVQVLILDGHSSHHSLAFLEHTIQHNIVVMAYPPHCTHALQGLDVVCFAKMKRAWCDAIDLFEEHTMHAVAKGDFAKVFGDVFLKAFDEETSRTAFRVTGVYPFDRSVITARQMKPSEVSSTTNTFPLPLPSPVRRVMAVFHHQAPTEFDVDPDTHMAAPLILTPTTSNAHTVLAQHILMHATKRSGDTDVDPSLYTPPKRIRHMTASLARSSSGSFLVSRTKFTSSQNILAPVLEQPPEIPEPNWALLQRPDRPINSFSRNELEQTNKKLTKSLDLAHCHLRVTRSINEAANAQLVIQDLYAGRLKVALTEKEKKSNDKTKLFQDGHGKVFTSNEVIQFLSDRETAKAQGKAEAAQHLTDRARKRSARDALEWQWETIKAGHTAAVIQWEINCRRWKEEGIPKKDQDAKPKRPKKPTLEEFEGASTSVAHNEGESGGESDGGDSSESSIDGDAAD
ncbi:hypothetical protein M0805_008479 [Coniferiporia weirii]|nr:hypothetical protein M0805_008479 [Coniferiporia weirii]